MAEPDWSEAIERARANAPFLARSLDRQPKLAELLAGGRIDEALAIARDEEAGEDTAVALRRARLALVTALAIGDLVGALPLERVMAELTGFADRALHRALAHAIERRTGEEPRGLAALALGKQGAGELNFSSDIDPILIYDPDTLPRRDRDEPGEAAARYVREAVRLLSDVTAEGYVFRVDLRLRPAAEATPPALTFNAALSHYESEGLAWERAAFIRARAAAGDRALGERFLSAVEPFVWRRSLDFGTIDAIADLTRRIREQAEGPQTPGPGFDVKRGRGGIREIEFFAQTHQLIHGGRDHSLRVRGTRAALDALAAAGRIGVDAAEELGAAYDRLRTVEHRLQMVEDRQTHSLPECEALDAVARLDGLADGDALIAELTALTEGVAARYGALIEEAGEDGSAPPTPDAERLHALGLDRPGDWARRLPAWSDGRFRAVRSPAAVEAFGQVLPALVERIGAASDPDRALARLETLLSRLPSGINLFRLLDARPALADHLAAILTLAPPLAEQLARRPTLLDALIDPAALDLPGSVAAIEQRLLAAPSGADQERRLDRLRIVVDELRFALGLSLVLARHDPLEVGAALGRVAEAAVRAAQAIASDAFAEAHGGIDGELVVLGFGRLGGGMLTHGSDLDIVHVFTAPLDAESDGERRLGASLYFNRLAARVGAGLSVRTAAGALYEVDTRLRPQGAQGPLACALDGFARYQRESAWTWEHMALTRARPLTGSDAARGAVREAIDAALDRPRDAATLRADVLAMRAKMAAAKPAQGPLDVKLARGGLVDCEFLVHFLQLAHRTGFTPPLGKAIDALAGKGLIDPALRDAHDTMMRALVAIRLLAPSADNPPPAQAEALARACGEVSLTDLVATLDAARAAVAEAWRATFDEELETA